MVAIALPIQRAPRTIHSVNRSGLSHLSGLGPVRPAATSIVVRRCDLSKKPWRADVLALM